MDRIGKYVIYKVSVTTGYAQVVFCHDPDLQVPVAIKLFDPRRIKDSPLSPAQWLTRFVFEARGMAMVDHTYVTPVKSLEQLPDGRPYFVMPYFAAHLAYEIGHDVASEIDGPRRLSLPRSILLLRQLSAALASMHRKGLVHRWVKPSNILLTAKEGGAIRLADFSMAKFPGNSSPPLPDIWPDQGAYTAPEQFENASGVGPQADVYSIGALAYRLTTGKVPTGGLATLEPTPDMPDALWALISQAMDPDPAKRPVNAGLLLSQFEGVPVDSRAKPVETITTTKRGSRSSVAS